MQRLGSEERWLQSKENNIERKVVSDSWGIYDWTTLVPDFFFERNLLDLLPWLVCYPEKWFLSTQEYKTTRIMIGSKGEYPIQNKWYRLLELCEPSPTTRRHESMKGFQIIWNTSWQGELCSLRFALRLVQALQDRWMEAHGPTFRSGINKRVSLARHANRYGT